MELIRSLPSRFLTAALVVGMVPSGEAPGVVVCDSPDTFVVTAQGPYAGVGYLSTGGGTTGVLIDPVHVLTARHAITGDLAGATFSLPAAEGLQSYAVVQKYLHPNANVDLAILVLAESTGLAGYELYAGRDEVGQTGIVVGFGESGWGLPQPALYPRGTPRAAQNRIESATAGYLKMRFDPFADHREGLIALGDSGGPLLLWADGELKIAGIHKGVSDFNGNGITPEIGDVSYHVRISDYLDWVSGLQGTAPEPSSAGAAAIGLAALLVRRRRPRR